jgi:hypothetical protein
MRDSTKTTLVFIIFLLFEKNSPLTKYLVVYGIVIQNRCSKLFQSPFIAPPGLLFL